MWLTMRSWIRLTSASSLRFIIYCVVYGADIRVVRLFLDRSFLSGKEPVFSCVVTIIKLFSVVWSPCGEIVC